MLHLKNVSALLLLSIFLGAGCTILPTLSSPHIADPIQPAGGATPIGQLQGFGPIPAPPEVPLRPGITGSIQITTPFPDTPVNVTVLRLASGYVNVDELRNITSALQIPGSSLGPEPAPSRFELEWKDKQGTTWIYHAAERRLEFKTLITSSLATPPETPPTSKELLETVAKFMDDYGIKRERYTEPRLEADPQSSTRVTVTFDATQDGQAIWNGDGSPVEGAAFSLDKNSQKILSGIILLSADPERSDYPGISQDQAREQMVRGGQGGTPRGDVTISDIKFEWMHIDDGKTPPTAYLYPALIGYGNIRYPEGTGTAYKIVVPLVKGK